MKKTKQRARPNQKVKQRRRKYSTKKTAGYQNRGRTVRGTSRYMPPGSMKEALVIDDLAFVERAVLNYFYTK